MHTGDENGATTEGGKGWFATIKSPSPVDVMIQNTWSNVIAEMVALFPPELIVPSHEHELSHGPGSRSTYASMIDKTSRLGVPFVMMAWGERIEVKK